MNQSGGNGVGDPGGFPAIAPTREELETVFQGKYGAASQASWGPKQRHDFAYFTPDDTYEAVVSKLVRPGIDWADVGCGHDIFPSNGRLAEVLSQRAGYVLGIDPDD